MLSETERCLFCFLKNRNVLRRVLTVVRAGVVKILQFQLCAMYQNKTFTHKTLHYHTAQKSVALYDESDPSV